MIPLLTKRNNLSELTYFHSTRQNPNGIITSMKTETQFKTARLPIDSAKLAAQFAVWPIHFTKTLTTNAVDTAFKAVGTNTEDVPHKAKLLEGHSVYDMARVNMDISSMIYYYTELRAEIKKLLLDFCQQRGVKEVDLPVLQGAVTLVTARLSVLSAKPNRPEESPTFKNSAVKEYQNAIAQLEGLCKRFKLNRGDKEILQTVRVELPKVQVCRCVVFAPRTFMLDLSPKIL